jgi:hypothetical protein
MLTACTEDMISQPALPESLVPKCLDILRALTPNEKELIRIVVEVIHELRDGQDEEEPVPAVHLAICIHGADCRRRLPSTRTRRRQASAPHAEARRRASR